MLPVSFWRSRGVAYYHDVALIVDDVPSTTFTRSPPIRPHQPLVRHQRRELYRSLDDGGSWENVAAFPGERVIKVALTNEAPGLLAVASQTPADGIAIASIVRISENAGESWGNAARLDGINVADFALERRDDGFVVLLATDKGLYEVSHQSRCDAGAVLRL